jgi:hypothetical protein
MDKKTKMIVCVLLAAVVVLAGIVVYGFYNGWLLTQQQYAATYGYQQAILSIVQMSRNCSVVPLTIGNNTYQLVDTNCAQAETLMAIVQASQGCKQVPFQIGNQTYNFIDAACVSTVSK